MAAPSGVRAAGRRPPGPGGQRPCCAAFRCKFRSFHCGRPRPLPVEGGGGMWSQAGGLRRKRTPTRRIPRAGELEPGPVVADRQLECDSASGTAAPTASRGQDWGGNQALVFGKFGTRGPAIPRPHTTTTGKTGPPGTGTGSRLGTLTGPGPARASGPSLHRTLGGVSPPGRPNAESRRAVAARAGLLVHELL
jgi:hypothetical protein